MLVSPMSGVQPAHHVYDQVLNCSAAATRSNPRRNGMADHSTAPPANKKPKLSLQTSSLPITYGKSSTALTFTASGTDHTTPTTLNTFSNAYSVSLPHRPSPNPATTSPGPQRQTSTPVSASRIKSSPFSRRPSHPYPYQNSLLGVKSILRNSPMPRPARSAISNSASPATTRRIFFPPIKKVKFRPASELEEVISNSRYLARHSDLSSESDSESGGEGASENEIAANSQRLLEDGFATMDDADDAENSADLSSSATSRKRKSRQVEAVELRERRPETSHMRTRKYSSRRKRRRWEWTLGPLDERPVTNLALGAESVAEKGSDTGCAVVLGIGDQAAVSSVISWSSAEPAVQTQMKASGSLPSPGLDPSAVSLPPSPEDWREEESTM